jgi:limonene-1,2-epoxide hydrolase
MWRCYHCPSWRFVVSNPAEVVREFCALMERRDPDALRPLLADNAVYQNVGMPAFTGVDAIVENMGAQFSMFPDAYAFEIVNIASDGSVVLTERLDYIQTPDGAKPAIPVMGTFVVGDNGKITRWTDYFDLNLTIKLLQGEDISALVPAASAT